MHAGNAADRRGAGRAAAAIVALARAARRANAASVTDAASRTGSFEGACA
jgi:hypothetical protein